MAAARSAGAPGIALRGLLARDGRRAPPVAVGALAVAVFTWWAVDEGGAAPGSWYPGALLFLAALVAVVRPGDQRRLQAPGRWALAALAAFTLWSFLSLTWADAPGDAWDGANRTLLYLTVFVLFAALPWKPAEAGVFLTAFALVTAGVGAWAVIRGIGGSDPAMLSGGRLAGPVGYENASAALFLAAFWPAVLLASRPATPWQARGILLAASSVLLNLCVLTQSRGSLIAGATALVLAVALTRERARLLLALAGLGVTTLASLPALLAVYDAAPADSGDALLRAAGVMGLSAAILLASGLASGRVARLPASVRRPTMPMRWLAATAAAALALGGLVLAGARPTAVPGAVGALTVESRFTAGAESGRYDFWRVAARQFAQHPLQGAGADNFAHDYARERRRREEPLYPHSVIMRTLGQTGIVGGVLLGGFFAAAFLSVRRLRGGGTREGVAVAAFVCAAAWLAHASIDWLWELPALTAPALACLGLIAGLCATSGACAAPEPSRPRLRHAGAIAVAVTGAAAVSYALPALAAREIEHAVARWDGDPAAALRGLERARRLNPLSDRADVIAGALTLQAGDRRRARRWFRRALSRDARNWYAEAALALVDLRDGRRAAALARLERARRLNPLEPAIAAAPSAAQRATPAPLDVEARVAGLAVPGPLGRRPVGCRPVLGLAAACVRGAGT
jgi:tetratricopeptide (TPR) repeat protein